VISNRARQQRAAVARIAQLGGTVQFAHEFDPQGGRLLDASPPGPPALRKLLGPEFFDRIVSVNLNGARLSGGDLRTIGKLRGVVFAQFNSTNFTDAGLAELRHWKELKSLGLGESAITGDGLRHLAGMHELNCLILEGSEVGDAGIAHLRSLRTVTTLSLGETRVTSRGVQYLQACQALSELSLHTTAVDDAALGTLLSLPNLSALDVTRTRISGRGLLQLSEALPTYCLDGHLIDLHARADQKLHRSANTWTQVVARAVALDAEDRLKLIDLSWCNIQDEHLTPLYDVKKVELINLRGSSATEQGIAALKAALPWCDVQSGND
jgi:hypothetical protein